MSSEDVQNIEKCDSVVCQLVGQTTVTGYGDKIECTKCAKKYHFVCKNLEPSADLEEAIAQKSYFCSQKCVNQHFATYVSLEQKFEAISSKLDAIVKESGVAKAQQEKELMEKLTAMEKSLNDKLAVASSVSTTMLISLEKKLSHQDQGIEVVLDKLNVLNQRSKKHRTHSIIIGRRVNSIEYNQERIVDEFEQKFNPPKEDVKVADQSSANCTNDGTESSVGGM
jgi:hypothetical protein